ncbi:hypothetical protein DN062_02210 [Nitrincola tibetensis]|uniref:Uncharacterized protein n=1 Tax=Nitrincola tibetensis TaxID=2219697 RepID=A0A364NS31_9GAMM|nr:hypothetical protein [Nitrincola tibetensis]RAU19908.1 hypothetical protein DN062_02210 [Nitrincola tibetensis]
MMLINGGVQLFVGLIMLVMLPINNAAASSTRDHFNEMYRDCVTREGGYLNNGIIAMCTQEVIDAVLVRLEHRVEEMSQPRVFHGASEGFDEYDREQRALFQSGVEEYQRSILQVCRYMGYHIGSPANPLCVMDMMVNLLAILDDYDRK